MYFESIHNTKGSFSEISQDISLSSFLLKNTGLPLGDIIWSVNKVDLLFKFKNLEYWITQEEQWR